MNSPDELEGVAVDAVFVPSKTSAKASPSPPSAAAQKVVLPGGPFHSV